MSYLTEVLADAPYGFWRMDASSGITEADLGSGKNNGVYSGDYSLGQSGIAGAGGNSAAGFNFTSDTGEMELTTGASIKGSFTVEAWVKPKALGNLYNVCWTSRAGEGGAGFSCDLAIRENKELNIDIGNGSGWLANFTVGVSLELGSWYHLVLAVSETGAKVYVNGALVKEQALSGVPVLWESGLRLHVARRPPPATTEYLDGTIDEFAVYSTVLSEGRVKAHYEAGTKDTRELEGSIEATAHFIAAMVSRSGGVNTTTMIL